jgi:MFS family permease
MPGIARSRWWVVAASTIAITCSGGPINIFTFGVFLRPVTEGLGVGRGLFASAMLATNWISAASGPILGILLDRYGARRVLLFGTVLFAAGTAAQSLLTSSVAVIYMFFALKALTGVGVSPVSFAFVVAKWFDRRRGLALGIAMAGVGLGTSIIPPTAAWLIGAYGWRAAYIGLGAVILVLAGLPSAFVIREPGEADHAELPQLARGVLPGMTMRSALGGWRFWALVAAFLIGVIVLNGTLTQIVALLQDRGWSLQQATSVLAASGAAAIFGRIASGWCVDRFHGPHVAAAFFVLPMIGTALFASGAGGLGPFLGALLCGTALGAEIDLMGFFVSRYFGLRAYGKIFGTMFGIFAGATGVGPFISGLSFDHYHSYLPAFALYEALLVVACLIFLPLGPYPFPAGRHVPIEPLEEKAPA